MVPTGHLRDTDTPELLSWRAKHTQWTQTHTHWLSRLWVDHQALVKVELATVILWRGQCVSVRWRMGVGTRRTGDTCLDKQFAASVSQQFVQPDLHLERRPLPLDERVLEGTRTDAQGACEGNKRLFLCLYRTAIINQEHVTTCVMQIRKCFHDIFAFIAFNIYFSSQSRSRGPAAIHTSNEMR